MLGLVGVVVGTGCAPPATARPPEPVSAPTGAPTGATAKPKAPPQIVYVRAGRLFDGTGDTVREHMAIVIEDERIKSVGPEASLPMPKGAKLVDLSGATVLPGLIDCHTHLGKRAGSATWFVRRSSTGWT